MRLLYLGRVKGVIGTLEAMVSMRALERVTSDDVPG